MLGARNSRTHPSSQTRSPLMRISSPISIIDLAAKRGAVVIKGGECE